ncbi:MAG: mechanosensitive ion channel domain-containing protein [Gammaproteobacteria bacterium]
MTLLEPLKAPLEAYPWIVTLLALSALALLIWVADAVTQRVLVRIITRVVAAIPALWANALLNRGVITRIAHIVPAMVVYWGVGIIPGLPEMAIVVTHNVANAYVIFTIALSLGYLLNAIDDIYRQSDPIKARNRPIKGYLQLIQLIVFVVAALLVVATLIDRSPLILLSGLGAMTAVVLLVFKDTILSLVASVQLSSQDLLRVGDWIEMPQVGADGDVIDIALHTVKVQNWDRTITTIPTWRLINESYRNWRGMSESGGRRIKRALYLDQTSVRHLTDEEYRSLRRIALIDEYLDEKRAEIEQWNATLLAEGKDPVNTRRVTNLGTFRAYAAAYLKAHPMVHSDMIQMVRQLQPGATGIPLEIYCFTATTQWVEYEGIQADIFDHLLAILPEFGLRVFQSPTGADLQAAIAEPAQQVAARAAASGG